MHYVRAIGMLAVGLLLIPAIWSSYGSLETLLDENGGRCIVNGDLGDPVAEAHLLTSEEPVADPPDSQTYQLQKGKGGYCQLSRSPTRSGDVWWQVNDRTYPQGYAGDLANQNFPPLEWDWDIRLTWAPELQTLEPSGWGARVLQATAGLMPLIVFLCAVMLALRELTRGGPGDQEEL